MKQNVTISLTPETLRKASIFAAKHEPSISDLLTKQIEAMIGEDEAYERAERQAVALLDQGFQLGGVMRVARAESHN